MANRISEEVLIQAILDAAKANVSDDNPLGATPCRELAKRANHDRGWTMQQLHKLIDEGKVGVTELVKVKIGNMRYRTPAYYMLDGSDLEEVIKS